MSAFLDPVVQLQQLAHEVRIVHQDVPQGMQTLGQESEGVAFASELRQCFQLTIEGITADLCS